jgi:hypothetical protein
LAALYLGSFVFMRNRLSNIVIEDNVFVGVRKSCSSMSLLLRFSR